jgi:hypothetical protein
MILVLLLPLFLTLLQGLSGSINLVHNLFQDLPPFDPTNQTNGPDTLTQAIDSHFEIMKVDFFFFSLLLTHLVSQ